jgi:parallel beta-helix repeat protein
MLCPFCQRPVDRFLPAFEGGTGLRCPLCGEDGVPALYPGDYDRHPAVPVCIFGPTGHGKTVYIEALLTHLERRVPWPDFAAQWMDQAGMRATRQRLQLLREHGQLPDATAAVFPRPQVIRLLGIPRVGGCQLLFYDTSGETFGDIELLRDRGRYVKNSPAVLWLVSLAELEYPEQLTDLMTVYAEAMAGMGGEPKSQTVVVALTKGDLLIDRPDLPAEAREFLLNDDLDPGRVDSDGDAWRRLEAVSNALEAWLKTTEHRRIVSLLRQQFKTVRFCILSSQGAAAQDQVLQMELLPRGVLAPLFWLWRETLPVAWVEVGSGRRHPFFSLAEAIARAPAGATVRLGPHAYVLPARLEVRRPITIAGPGPDAALVRCAAEGFVLGVGISQGEVIISGVGFAHTGTEPADVVLVRKGSVVMQNCAVRGGVAQNGRCPGDGVRVGDDAAIALAGCVVEQNQGSGVAGRDQARVGLHDCRILANGFDGVHAAGAVVEVHRCEFTENQRSGLHLTANVQATIHDTTCTRNGRNGIGAFLDALADLRRNTCEENRLDGIVVKDRVLLTAVANVCNRNQQAGISIHDTVTGELLDSRCAENQLSGIEVEDAAGPALSGNRCTRNRGSGINYSGTARGDCTANSCERNTGHGVAVAGAATPEIDENASVGNRGAGFWVAEGARPTFGRKNTAHGNTKGDFQPPKWGRGGWFG